MHIITVSDDLCLLDSILRVITHSNYMCAEGSFGMRLLHYYLMMIQLRISPLYLLYSDVLYAWENPEYKVVEDSESVVVNLCLVSESGTLTFPVDISVTSTAISATGI